MDRGTLTFGTREELVPTVYQTCPPGLAIWGYAAFASHDNAIQLASLRASDADDATNLL